MTFNPVLLQAYYTFILFMFSMFLWSFKHRGGYPVLSNDENYGMMCFLMHVCDVTRISDLRDWGIPKNTIKAFYAAEMRNYKTDHPNYCGAPVRRPYRKNPELKEKSKMLREERLQRELIREEVNLRSWKKLDEAIRERYECAKSVTDWFYHRGEKHG